MLLDGENMENCSIESHINGTDSKMQLTKSNMWLSASLYWVNTTENILKIFNNKY